MPAGHHLDSDSTLLPLPKSAITWFGGIFARLREQCLLGCWTILQGSVMRPILFTCYIKPLGAISRKQGLGLHMYADDAQVYISFKPVGGCEIATELIEACVTEIR